MAYSCPYPRMASVRFFIGGVMRLVKRTSVAVALALLGLALGCSADTVNAMVCDNGDNGTTTQVANNDYLVHG